ncbi:MAG: hypothetical protein ACRDD8_06755, partial [Bacteroidales bacterium]
MDKTFYFNDKLTIVYNSKDKLGMIANKLTTATSWCEMHVARSGGSVNTIEVDNDEFTLTILEGPENSSYAGKLSTSMCCVKQGDFTVNIGISTNALVDLMKYTTLVNGVFKEKIAFVLVGGRFIPYVKGSKVHTNMLSHNEKLLNRGNNANYATSFEIGKVYKYVQSGKHMLFLGEYKFKRVYLDGGKEKNTKMYVFVTYYSHLRTITSKEFLESSLFPVHPYEILASKPKLVETEISIDLSNIDV